MTYCPNCKLKKTRWATSKGFSIEKKAYCCMGCGFTGCICLPLPKSRKRPPTPIPK
jgi:hypothetical protein